jgi:FtsZ-binding cell division protein ZapB
VAGRKEVNVFNIAFLDLISGALGAVIILYVAVPKSVNEEESLLPPNHVTLHESEIEALKLPYLLEIEEMKKQISALEEEAKAAKEKPEEVVAASESMVEDEKVTKESVKAEPKTGEFANGFHFKGNQLVFIIDVSGSMVHEDRMGQVRAGLKMFITSLSEEYSFDIIFYPDGRRGLYRPLWGYTKPAREQNKREAFAFLDALFPFGSTPTREVLKYALGQYRQVTDIILLSDGAPTVANRALMDNIPHLLREIRSVNRREVQINTIGVGSDMVRRERSIKYEFLNQLAKEHGGFFHPF